MRRLFPLLTLLFCCWVAVFLVASRNQFFHLHHTWTLSQTVKHNAACTTTPCTVTVTATGAGHLLVANFISDSTSELITAVTAGACSGSWVISAATAMSQAGNGSGELAYCLNSLSGVTSIAMTFSGGSCTCAGTVWEVTSSTGSIALDTGATPAGKVSDTTCTSCAGTALSLSGSNKFIVATAAAGNTCTGLTGTGFTNDFTDLGDCQAHGINIATSGTVTSPATWTQGSGTLIGNAIAFKEAAAGGVATMPVAVY